MILLILGAICLACFVYLVWSLATAPDGWEDDEGFHEEVK